MVSVKVGRIKELLAVKHISNSIRPTGLIARDANAKKQVVACTLVSMIIPHPRLLALSVWNCCTKLCCQVYFVSHELRLY